ncbi:hypothetical protein MPTK1_2g06360 [Marchantia polymorpha subsp. ruderalis]|uniref:Uncharacterized protein n=1 Tax=Marchantia polymorpha TaxID=3197 RepID=A0A2R6XDQ5_MARPO|nr:hypothetical protein MARPO_0021s0091 [Marchantia polymorpha]BBN01308.1 hypothetical protein Mp_2g06360 [Marchantia polymorpha subsp. ruderalis]|eukprot:PTQ44233.1 hypothetical protein MARPO_0021s0091 [Marchantia polymorpha]
MSKGRAQIFLLTLARYSFGLRNSLQRLQGPITPSLDLSLSPEFQRGRSSLRPEFFFGTEGGRAPVKSRRVSVLYSRFWWHNFFLVEFGMFLGPDLRDLRLPSAAGP